MKCRVVQIDGDYFVRVRKTPHAPPILVNFDRIGVPYPRNLGEAQASLFQFRKDVIRFCEKGVRNG